MEYKQTATKTRKQHKNANVIEPFVIFRGRFVLAAWLFMLRTY